MVYITKTSDLEEFCRNIADEDFISIDTEFCRDKTYYPILCLIQIATKTQAVIIDPLSKDLDLSSLGLILQNEKIVKVFHSAKQDLEILKLLYGKLPQNIFDTQIAASFCSIGDVISYESLVNQFFNITIDKTYCLSDWTHRPLNQEQLDYALADVTYLYRIYPKIMELLKKNGRLSWAKEEIDRLNRAENFAIDASHAWRKIKNTHGIKINLVLKRLAAWRENQAQALNLPRNHYLKEKYLLELAINMPIILDELRSIQHFQKISEQRGQEIIDVIQTALNDQIQQDLSGQDSQHNKINLEKLVKLKSLLHSQAEKHSLPPRLIATAQDLKDLSNDNPSKDHYALNGWRREVFGKRAIELGLLQQP